MRELHKETQRISRAISADNSHGNQMNTQSHPIKVLLIDDDEDDYIVVRDRLSDFSSTEFILKWVSDYGSVPDGILSGHP
jgi:hypothetical protein